MRYGSVCSGIEAATAAWHHLGWTPAWVSEIEKFPAAVLAHHYPDVPNLGDMTKLENHAGRTRIDLLVGGTPCQSFSVAGLRKGMADARGNLALVFILLLRRARARWVLWENVPGVLSSGNDFGCFLGGLVGRELARPEEGWGGAGIIEPSGPEDYGIAWRVLDAQHFGVPQRRRRVFVVGYLGDWRPAAAVLFERDGLPWDPSSSGEAGEDAPAGVGPRSPSHWDDGGGPHPTLNQSAKGSGGIGASNQEIFSQRGGGLVPGPTFYERHDQGGRVKEVTVAPSVSATADNGCEVPLVMGAPSKPMSDDVAGTISANHGNIRAEDAWGGKLVTDMRGRGDGKTAPTLCTDHASRPSDYCPVVFTAGNLSRGAGPSPSEKVSPTLKSDHGRGRSDQDPVVAFTQNSRSEVREIGGDGQVTGAVTAEPGAQCQNYLKTASAVRRLTPRECERLQGFPDDYTLIPWKKGVAPDGPRYKALGNSMAVPVMRWLGERIAAVDEIIQGAK